MNFQYFAKIIIVLGIGMVIFGALLYFGGRIGLGRLPGDIYMKKGNFTFYFPIVTCILASIIMTIIFSFIRR